MKILYVGIISIFFIILLSNTATLQHYANASYPPPLQQYQHGIPFNQIKCNQGFTYVYTKNGLPACVKLATAVNLVDRGWWLSYVKMVWFRYATDGVTAPWSSLIPSDLWKNSAEQCVMGSAVWKYFKNQGITPLEITFGQEYDGTRGDPYPPNPPTVFLIHVLQNDSSTMNKLGFKEYYVNYPARIQNLTACNTSP